MENIDRKIIQNKISKVLYTKMENAAEKGITLCLLWIIGTINLI